MRRSGRLTLAIVRTIDDRSRLVPIRGRLPWRGMRITRSSLWIADEPGGPQALRHRRAIRAFLLESAVMLACYVGLVAAMITWLRPTGNPWIEYPRSVLTGIMPGSALIWLIARLRRRSFVSAATEHERCLACTHSLTGMPIEADGCVVCPECGAAAWRVKPRDDQSSNASR